MTEEEYIKKYIHPEDNLEEALERLKNGEPVQYIVGDTNFYGNIIKVNKDVLIPRPETEELVEKTSEYIKKYFNENIDIIDIGTGSGCIPIALKQLFPVANVTGVDISEKALKVAEENKIINNVSITYLQSNIFSNVKGKYDVIISNPPYIREDEQIMDIVKNNEPHLALYAKDNGLYFYKEILKNANKYLKEKFIISFEIGEEQGNDIVSLAKVYFPDTEVLLEKDLRHFDRFVFIIKK
jgi:release factor glutamine methyltransferase